MDAGKLSKLQSNLSEVSDAETMGNWSYQTGIPGHRLHQLSRAQGISVFVLVCAFNGIYITWDLEFHKISQIVS